MLSPVKIGVCFPNSSALGCPKKMGDIGIYIMPWLHPVGSFVGEELAADAVMIDMHCYSG